MCELVADVESNQLVKSAAIEQSDKFRGRVASDEDVGEAGHGEVGVSTCPSKTGADVRTSDRHICPTVRRPTVG